MYENIENEAAAAASAADDFLNQAPDAPEAPAGISFDFLAFLKTPTGPGSIESYIGHPLNAHESRGIAQILRGSTGLFGALDLAIIDIMIGGFAVIQERKAKNNVDSSDE